LIPADSVIIHVYLTQTTHHFQLVIRPIIVFTIIIGLLAWVINQFILFRSTDTWPVWFFYLPGMSPFAFYRGINLLNKRTYAIQYLEGEMVTVLVALLISTIYHYALALYVDVVMPREFGVTRHPLFFLAPLKKLVGMKDAAPVSQPPPADEDDDVAVERKQLEATIKRRADTSSSTTEEVQNVVETLSLRKVYNGGKVAVRNLTFSVRQDECFGLLGPNGAGKTTTISMLTGLYPPTAGWATVCGHDIRTAMTKVYEQMGVCPQFDILWPLLTVVETLRFYCKVKGVPYGTWHDTAMKATAGVDLLHAKNRRVGKLSGGMKRRVSLAISLIGSPSVIFLDEPTTGLDPETKRAMWTLVDQAKAGRAIVLTTHSMEEADALCGRISIMAYGQMRCLGTSLHLKKKFGEGYKIVVTYQDGKGENTNKFVTMTVPGAKLIGDFNNTATFMIQHNEAKLSAIFEAMKARPDEIGIVDWALRQTSMEEVFLRVAHEAEVARVREIDDEAAEVKGKSSAKVDITGATNSVSA